MQPIVTLIALLIAGATQTLALPQATGTAPTACTIPNAGPFQLFATRTDTGESHPVRLVSNSDTFSDGAISHMIVSTDETCTDCGVLPSSWKLDNMVLFADVGVSGLTTLSQNATGRSELTFLSTTSGSPQLFPIYCGVSGNGNSNEATTLSVAGNNQVVMCAFVAISPPPTQFDIRLARPLVAPVGEGCFIITLELR